MRACVAISICLLVPLFVRDARQAFAVHPAYLVRVSPSVVDLGSIPCSSTHTRRIRLTRFSNAPVRVSAIETTCGLSFTRGSDDLSVPAPGDTALEIILTAQIPAEPGEFVRILKMEFLDTRAGTTRVRQIPVMAVAYDNVERGG